MTERVLRGKLLVPECEVDFGSVKYIGNSYLKENVVKALTAMAMTSCQIAKGDGLKAMDVFTDLVTAFYKLPMFISHAPVAMGKFQPTAFEYFLIYVVARHVKEVEVTKETPLEEIFNALESFEHVELLRRLVREYFHSIRDVYEALLNTPADTRPGFNFTSLASHLQMTSLMSWLLQTESVDLNYLRLASLLHDLGKLINPKEHVTASLEILNEVAKRLEGSCIELDRVAQLIKTHHGGVETIVQRADRLAASADRLERLVKEALEGSKVPYSDEYGQCLSSNDTYECISRLGEEKYTALSKELYKYILGKVVRKKTLEDPEAKLLPCTPSKVEGDEQGSSDKGKPKGGPKGYLVYIDLPSIQKFITNFPKLRDMSFASMLVDFLVTVYAFMLLDTEFYRRTSKKSRLPAEALLSGYGGHSYIVVRSDFCQKDCVKEVKEALRGLKPLEELDVKLSVYVSDFAYEDQVLNYQDVWDNIEGQFYERYLVDFAESVYSIGLHRVCENCGLRPAAVTKDGRYLCKRCSTIHNMSTSRGFMSKVGATYLINGKEVSPLNSAKDFSENFSEYAMEFIAGYKDENDSKYVALLKADGNRGGAIFKMSATFSEYVDKSFRLDYGVKKAFYETLAELLEAEEKEGINKDSKDSLVGRVLSGVLYLGGDDITLLLPSVVALPFAVRLFEKASEYTGFTFKVGIVVVKPDHPVQFAFQAADELMEKSKIRDKYETSIATAVFSSTLASRAVIDTEIKRGQDYFVVTNSINDVRKLLELANLYDLREVVKLYNSPEAWELTREKLRALEDLVSYAETSRKGYYDVIAYAIRGLAKSGGYDRDLLRTLLKAADRGDGKLGKVPLYDYYFMLKTFRVGVGARSSRS